jgi:hypothetical protein
MIDQSEKFVVATPAGFEPATFSLEGSWLAVNSNKAGVPDFQKYP